MAINSGGAASVNAQWESGKNSPTPSYSSSQQTSNTFFSSKREPSRLLITNPVGSQVAGNFIKQNSPGSFNRGAQEAKTPLALWPNTKAQLQTSFPHSMLPVTLFSCLLFTSVSTSAHCRVTPGNLARVM